MYIYRKISLRLSSEAQVQIQFQKKWKNIQRIINGNKKKTQIRKWTDSEMKQQRTV